MELTPLRWLAVVTSISAAGFLTLLPVSKRPVASWVPPQPAPLAVAMGQLSHAAAQASAAVREYRAARGLERWRAANTGRGDTTRVRLDGSVPPTVAAAVRDSALGALTTLGRHASAAHAEVFVFADSAEIPRPAGVAVRRPLEPRRFVDVAFALPEATGGVRCVVLVRLRGTTAAHVAALRNQSLAGPCAFFAAFGLPGEHVQSWLSATEYTFARESDWDVPRGSATDATAIYGLSAAAARCLTGDRERCRVAVGVTTAAGHQGDARESATAWVLDGRARLLQPGRAQDLGLGYDQGRFLADVVRDLSPERFALFWRSKNGIDDAFAGAAGMPLEEWTQRWLTRTYGSTRGRPRVRVADALWLAAALPILIVVAARPRDRVLVERFGVSR